MATRTGRAGIVVVGEVCWRKRRNGPCGQHRKPLFLAHEVGLGERHGSGDSTHLRLGLGEIERIGIARIDTRIQDPDVVLEIRELLATQRKPLARADHREPGLRGFGDDRELRVAERSGIGLDPAPDGAVLVPQAAEQVDFPARVESGTVGVGQEASGRREWLAAADLRAFTACDGHDRRKISGGRQPGKRPRLGKACCGLCDRRVRRERPRDQGVKLGASEP